MYIDATVIKGRTKPFTCSIQTTDGLQNQDPSEPTHDNLVWNPYNLSGNNIRFRVMGSPTADAKVLVEHIISDTTDEETEGQITDVEGGQFTFVITAEDTLKLGLGNHPIMIDIIDAESGRLVFGLTEGGRNGEFSKIQVVQV